MNRTETKAVFNQHPDSQAPSVKSRISVRRPGIWEFYTSVVGYLGTGKVRSSTYHFQEAVGGLTPIHHQPETGAGRLSRSILSGS